MDGSSYCYVHHPAHAEERRRHGSKGGKRGGRGRDRVDRGVAAVASQVLNVYLRAVSVELKAREQLELIERLEALEQGLERQKESHRYGA
jgi:hypothetical protein